MNKSLIFVNNTNIGDFYEFKEKKKEATDKKICVRIFTNYIRYIYYGNWSIMFFITKSIIIWRFYRNCNYFLLSTTSSNGNNNICIELATIYIIMDKKRKGVFYKRFNRNYCIIFIY